MKNILLIGEWKSPNLGDSVLCNCCYKYIEKELPEHNLIKFDLSFGINPSHSQYWLYDKLGRLLSILYRLSRKSLSNLTLSLSNLRSKIFLKSSFKQLPHIDYIIFCGGQIFLDYFTYCISEIVLYAESKKIPIIWNACGGSELSSLSTKILNRCINSPMTKLISVRDNISDFKRINPKAKLVPDTAVLVSETYSYSNRQKNLIGLGVMSYNLIKERLKESVSENDVLVFWSNLIAKIEKAGLEWQFFTNGDPGDYNTALQFLQQLGYKNINSHICDKPSSDCELVNLVSKFDAIVSFRLHSHIIAYSLGIPSYGLAWDPKVIDFFALSNRQKYCSSLGELNPDKAFDFISCKEKSISQSLLIETAKQHMYNDIITQL